ncbi:MAG: CPBP family intramembrane metalloprotease, partial [Leptospiraceae bacterium]|nr:CPBP family intramembrane metalloprotease [Leptospiraceae bacterium]
MNAEHAVPRPLWQRYLAVLLYFFVVLGALQIIGLVIGQFYELPEGPMPFRVLLFSVILQMACFMLPAPLLLQATRSHSFGFSRAAATDMVLAAGLVFVSLMVFSAIYHALGVTPQQLAFVDEREIVRHRHAFVVLTTVVVPAYEEWIFRGVVFGVLTSGAQSRNRVIAAAVFTSAAFTLSHIEGRHSWAALPPIFVLSLVFHFVTWRAQSLWPAVFA